MKHQKTVVLMWNPQISSVKESDYAEWFNSLCTFRERFCNWSVWDHQHVNYGDKFVLVRVGDEKAGIVMEGIIVSDCYEGKDWAGSDRMRYYVDLVPVTAYSPEECEYPSQSQLQKAVPDFDWSGGHSGRVLTDRQACELHKFLKGFKESSELSSKDLSKVRIRNYIIRPSYIHPTEEELSRYPTDNPRPFIESFIKQSIGIPACRIEKDWKKHSDMWLRDHEDLLRTAAWLAFPIREEIPYYGAMCLKLSRQYWGVGENKINAAYAKEAADFLTNRELKHEAIMIWLAESLRSHLNWGTGYAVSPLVREKVSGLDVLSEFIGCNVLEQPDMLHDYYVRNIEVNTENDYINIDVSYDPEGDEEEVLTFHISGGIDIEANIDSNTCLYINEAQIGPWEEDDVQLFIGGYCIRARGNSIDVYIKKSQQGA